MEHCLVKSFCDYECDFYSNDGQYYMTCEQIGRALEYSSPRVAINNIISRNRDRFTNNSTDIKLMSADNKEHQTTILSLRGVMEVCRLSRQPKADKFMDFVWDVMENLYRGDAVLATPDCGMALTAEAFDEKFDCLLREVNTLRTVTTKIGMELKRLSSSVPPGTFKTSVSTVRGEFVPDETLVKPEMSKTKQAWYDDNNRMMRDIEIATGDEPKRIMSKVYKVMSERYNVDLTQKVEEAKRRWHKAPGEKVSIISAIAADQDLRIMYHGILLGFHRDIFGDNKNPYPDNKKAAEQNPAAKSIPVQVTNNAVEIAQPELPAADPTENPLKPKRTKVVQFPAEPYDKVEKLVVPIAQKMGDKSNFYMVTYRRIFSRMGLTDWKTIENNYKKKNNVAAVTKHEILLDNQRMWKQFKDAAMLLVEEIENKTAREEVSE